jgi:hypothetical protein
MAETQAGTACSSAMTWSQKRMLWKIAAGAIKPGTPFEQEKSSYQRPCPMTALSQKPPLPMWQLGAWLAGA